MIRLPALTLLRSVADRLTAAGVPRPWPFLSLSYQDVAVTPAELAAALGPAAAAAVPYRTDSKAIVDWHKCNAITERIPDWHAVLIELGFVPTSTDIVRARGCEEYLDLNQDLAVRHVEHYAVVLDNVAHHCFDVAQAVRNIARMPRLGGYVIHMTPLTMVNHGFYTLNPTLLHDFYTANGYEVVSHTGFAVVRDASPCPEFPIDPARRLKGLPDNAMQLFLAKRIGVRRPVVVPTQAKFVHHPTSTMHPGEAR